MAGARASWLVDGNRFATKIKSASGASDPAKINWKSNPTRACPNCQRTIDNSDVTQEWPGLPRGVKFDPSDQEIILHLLAKLCIGDLKPHPFIDEFIPTVDEDDGICYTHPRNLPGVKQDGSASHFFHRAIKAYNTGTRKRRKIHGDDSGDVRWHKTGRTKPVILDAVQRGCKKIMVLYASTMRGGKPEKTNWVMHQYHLGTEEDEKDGELVVSKVFYQQQQIKQNDKNVDDDRDGFDDVTLKVDPVTPKSVTPEPPCVGWRASIDSTTEPTKTCMDFIGQDYEQGSGDDVQTKLGKPDHEDEPEIENHDRINGDQAGDDPKWWDGESQYLLDSQQLVEGLSLCEDLLQSQSPSRDGNDNDASKRGKPGLSDYAHLGPEHLKKDLEECQNLVFDPANIELDTPPDFRLSQLEFGSQESFLAWGGSKVAD